MQSKALALCLVSFLVSSISILVNANWYLLNVVYLSMYLAIYLIDIIISTALHEGAHFEALASTGFEVGDITVHRIGNVSFSIKNSDNMTVEQNYVVSCAPFVNGKHIAIEGIFLVLLVLLNIYAWFPLNALLAFFTALSALSFIASICALNVIKSKKTSGICISIAKITSREDIEDIVTWNKLSHN